MAAIAKFIGIILATILPAWVKEYKKPTKVRMVGDGPELKESINESMAESIRNSSPSGVADDLERVRRRIEKGQTPPSP